MEKINILIIDDHALVREAYGLLLQADSRFKVVASAGSGEEAIEIISKLRPDIVLLDINLPGTNGIEATHLITKISPTTKVLGVSMHSQPALAGKMMRNGAKGYVTKTSSAEELRKAIIEVYHNRKYICDEIQQSIANSIMNECDPQSALKLLSNREIEIIEFVKKGFSSKEIANSLRINFRTIEAHRYNIMKKLKLKNASALVNYVNSAGLSLYN